MMWWRPSRAAELASEHEETNGGGDQQHAEPPLERCVRDLAGPMGTEVRADEKTDRDPYRVVNADLVSTRVLHDAEDRHGHQQGGERGACRLALGKAEQPERGADEDPT